MTGPIVGANATAWPLMSGGWLIEAHGTQPYWVPNRTAARRELNARALTNRPPLAGEAVRPASRRLVTAGEAPTADATAGAGDYFPPT